MNRFRDALELIFILALIVACHVTKKAEQVTFPVFDMEGHRGCRGLMPENTVPAMMKALDLGVTTLEMDACITKDKRVILSHDPFFNHDITIKPDDSAVTKAEEKSLAIYGMTFSETQRYDVGLKPYPKFPQQERLKATKPLLNEVIADAEAYIHLKGRPEVFYNIETKTNPATDGLYHPPPEEFVDILMKVISRRKVASRVIIQSFDYRTLKIVHEKHPGIKTSALVNANDKRSVQEHLLELGFTPTVYSPSYNLVTKELVDECHRLQMKIVPWTVNDKMVIVQLKQLGVDGIISDYPNLFSE